MSRFIDELVAGTSTVDDFDFFVQEWHDSDSKIPLHTFLGLSWDEYKVISTNPDALKYVVQARKAGVETGFPEIVGCACGSDHDSMPRDTEYDDETGESFEYDLVCRRHRKHEPCRPCQSELRARKNETQ